jgi:predicted nucleic acid-binding protein
VVEKVENLFWDSCVFYAFLNDSTATYDIESIGQYLDSAKSGKSIIYTSSIAIAEVVPSAIRKPEVGTFLEFVEDFEGAIIVSDSTPNVMQIASQLKDLPYIREKSSRRLGTGDTIMLATCIHLIESYGVNIDVFHTFDDGKARDPIHGKMVPILSYHSWCGEMSEDQKVIARRVLTIKRKLPIFPTPRLPFIGALPSAAVAKPDASSPTTQPPPVPSRFVAYAMHASHGSRPPYVKGIVPNRKMSTAIIGFGPQPT